jgi:chromosome partitioning protein
VRKWVLANQKGGVGKTSLALNLAVCAEADGLLTSVIDLDPQESAAAWYKRRGKKQPIVVGAMPDKVEDTIKAAERMNVSLCILDTPPKLDNVTLAAMRLADLIIVPVRACLLDLHATRTTVELLKAAGKLDHAIGIMNAVPTGKGSAAYIAERTATVEELGLAMSKAVLHYSPKIEKANDEGLAITELRPKDPKAVNEMQALWTALDGHGKRKSS